MNNRKIISILGIRGIPAAHGGFETFAERLAPYLIARGWDVTVYCQSEGDGPVFEDIWEGVRRVTIPVRANGPLSTVTFDWRSTLLAAKRGGLILTLGYNTALFCFLYRLSGVRNLINMDGLEWKRAKWSTVARTWLWINERLGCWFGNHLIADHPVIADHLATRVSRTKITMIPYGADKLSSASDEYVIRMGLVGREYILVIARPEPENSILEIVESFSRKKRGVKLVVLGRYEETNPYHMQVRHSASDEVLFPGAIYDRDIVEALRYHALFYVHGHRVGGTNPSLVEALGAGNPVLAHDNPFNRWVADQGGIYFKDADDCALKFDLLLSDKQTLEVMAVASKERHTTMFTWESVLQAYESLLTAHRK